MFFKRSNKDKAHAAGPPDAAAAESSPKPSGATDENERPRIAGPANLIEPASLGFATTAELEPAAGPIGQERALRTIAFGIGMTGPGFHVFVCGPPDAGKRTAVRACLETKTRERPAPSDWVYVTDFADSRRPRALQLPAGRAIVFATAMAASIDELRDTLPSAFEAEDTQTRRRAIGEEDSSGSGEALAALTQKAAAQNIALLRTPTGFTLAPMHEGRIVKPDVFTQLPEAMRSQVEAKVEALQRDLAKILAAAMQATVSRRSRIAALNEEVSRSAIDAALAGVRAPFADLPAVMEHLVLTAADLVRNAGLFLTETEAARAQLRLPSSTPREPPIGRYGVTVMAAGEGSRAAPVIEETNPAGDTLAGFCETAAVTGAHSGEQLMIHPGALHRANGGTLLLEARDLLAAPGAWAALKRALKSGRIAIEPNHAGLRPAPRLREPEPIALDVKVILFGSTADYDRLDLHDPGFARLFQVRASFADRIENNPDHQRTFARLVAAIAARHRLKAVDAAGVAELIGEAARMTGEPQQLCVETARIADLVRAADSLAAAAGHDVITREDMTRAIADRDERNAGFGGGAIKARS